MIAVLESKIQHSEIHRYAEDSNVDKNKPISR